MEFVEQQLALPGSAKYPTAHIKGFDSSFFVALDWTRLYKGNCVQRYNIRKGFKRKLTAD